MILLGFVFSAHAALNIGTFNIRNFDKPGTYTNKNLLKETIQKNAPDLLAVQEIYNDWSFKAFITKEFPEYSVVLSSCGGGGQQKLGFVYNRSKLQLLNSYEDRRLTDSFTFCGSLRPAYVGYFKEKSTSRMFVALSIHLKAGSGSRNFERRAEQYRTIQQMFSEFKAKGYKDVVAMGDFNTTGYDHRNADYNNFVGMLSRVDADTSAEKVSCTSYWTGKDYNDRIEEPSTLDHVVYTDNFLGKNASNTKVGGHCEVAKCQEAYEDALGESYQTVSDHCPVTVSFN